MTPNFSFGYRPDVRDDRDDQYKYFLAPETLLELPTRASVKDLFPPVYSQGDLGSCVGQATKALMNYAYTKQGEPGVDLSALMIYFNARVMEGTVKEDAGCTP